MIANSDGTTIVVSRASGDVVGPPVPPGLAELADDALRIVDGEVIDARGRTEWWIDALGRKQAAPLDPAWIEIVCAWSDEIEPDGSGGWRVVSPVDAARRDLISYAADKRWRLETGGVTVGGIPVATDDRSKLLITGARVAANADPAWTTTWIGSDGNAYPVDAAQMIVISDAVQAHVNGVFSAYAEIVGKIAAGEITTTAAIDAAFAVS